MIFVVELLGAALIGALIGAGIMACCNASGSADRREEQMRDSSPKLRDEERPQTPHPIISLIDRYQAGEITQSQLRAEIGL